MIAWKDVTLATWARIGIGLMELKVKVKVKVE